MSRASTAVIVAALLLSLMAISSAARPDPSFSAQSAAKIRPEGTEGEERCEGDSEECLMKRTLAAHLDYIYTQKQPPHTKPLH
ncbi:PREDICTED: phytosulfokines-like [Tarenaya hassleriana]|uniref:phytosulfokines-like n=1 Tax=Tarenaya hassleriana TaxID=28532 RepID=UPI00053C44B9|nr:PREDICTED: phytosulfokines-like [Tarenaya hassleriana]